MISSSFWRTRRVLVTGHSGFKGAWLCCILDLLGSEVGGFSLAERVSSPSMFELVRKEIHHTPFFGDVCNPIDIGEAIREFSPNIVIHLAGQPIVARGYSRPVETFRTNVLGTVSLITALRDCQGLEAVVVVTSDKVYKNDDVTGVSFSEEAPLGGIDPYSCSKSLAEYATVSLVRSFFGEQLCARFACARAGNVIGGGDWGEGRLIPDLVRAWSAGEALTIRNPNAVRPWQHVLEPLCGYLLLAERIASRGAEVSSPDAYNFGPPLNQSISVSDLIGIFEDCVGNRLPVSGPGLVRFNEHHYLTIDSTKARTELGWNSKLSTRDAVAWAADWYRAHKMGLDVSAVTKAQIERYFQL
jgi:CDP-glucose 4,6-dehydratase